MSSADVKERPILMNAAMVRAVLADTKTQTRRVVKLNAAGRVNEPGSPRNWHLDDPNAVQACPYGQPGDRLWVRESWQYAGWTEDGEPIIGYMADNARLLRDGAPFEWSDRLADTWAALSTPENYDIDQRAADRCWRPSIHMPRWASRITLEVTGVRVERLNEISEEDALAEGITVFNGTVYAPHQPEGKNAYSNARGAFGSLWESINGPGSWDANPWVWAVEFKRVTP